MGNREPVRSNSTGRGRKAIQEAALLLSEKIISHFEPAYSEGDMVSVFASPQWNTEGGNETFRLLITCDAFGQIVDWEGIPVLLRPLQSEGTPAIGRLDRRGQTFFPELTPAEYRISLPSQVAARIEPRADQVYGLAAKSALPTDTSEQQDAAGALLEPILAEYDDGKLRVMVIQEETGDITVSAETEDASLAGHCVSFFFENLESARLEHKVDVILRPSEDEESFWEGETTVRLDDACRLLCLYEEQGR